jgi:putative ABC transport system permease protein
MSARDITLYGMAAAYGTIAVSLGLLWLNKVPLKRQLLLAFGRMSVQLALVGFYLTAMFELNNPFVNVGWVLVMCAVANLALLRGSGLKLKMFLYTFPALLIAIGTVLCYFIVLVFAPEPLLDARYLIPVAGMLLGNSMNRTLITLERFYSSVRSDADGYSSCIAIGASVREAAAPYISIAYRVGLSPWLANLATIGLVFLPGMMTGQVLGGSSPLTAIKYQIAIIIAIHLATELSSLLAIRFSMKKGFDEFGFLRLSIFK